MKIALLAVKIWRLELKAKLNIVLEPREYIGYLGIEFVILVAVCAIASAIIIKNGLIQNQLNPIRIRTRKTNPKQLVSFFTYRLDHIRNCLKQPKIKAKKMLKRILDYDSVRDFNCYFPQLLQKL